MHLEAGKKNHCAFLSLFPAVEEKCSLKRLCRQQQDVNKLIVGVKKVGVNVIWTGL